MNTRGRLILSLLLITSLSKSSLKLPRIVPEYVNSKPSFLVNKKLRILFKNTWGCHWSRTRAVNDSSSKEKTAVAHALK